MGCEGTAVNASASNGLGSVGARAATYGALGLILVLTPGGVWTADAAKNPPVEIKLREIDPALAAQVSYTRQVKPVFANNCMDCHSADERKGGLDVSSVRNLMKGGKKAGPAIVPGQPDESPLVQHLRGLREPQMPKGNPALSEEEVHLIRQWIFAGAKDDSAEAVAERTKGDGGKSVDDAGLAANDPGAQQALNDLVFSGNGEDRLLAQRRLRLALLPKPPEPPQVKGPVFNAIDQFIVAKWEQAGLPVANDPPGVCSDAAFLRRVYLDVIGTLPTAKVSLGNTGDHERVFGSQRKAESCKLRAEMEFVN